MAVTALQMGELRLGEHSHLFVDPEETTGIIAGLYGENKLLTKIY